MLGHLLESTMRAILALGSLLLLDPAFALAQSGGATRLADDPVRNLVSRLTLDHTRPR